MNKFREFLKANWIIFIIALGVAALVVGMVATDDDDGSGRVGQTPPAQEEPVEDEGE